MPSDPTKQSIERLQAAVAAEDAQAITKQLTSLQPADAVHAISHLSDLDQSRLLTALPRAEAARLVDNLPEAQAAQMIERLPAAEAAAIVSELPSNEQADVIARLVDFRGLRDSRRDAGRRGPRRSAAAGVSARHGRRADDHRVSVVPRQSCRWATCSTTCGRNAERYRSFDVQYAYVVSRRRETCRRVAVARLVAVVAARSAVGRDDRRAAAASATPRRWKNWSGSSIATRCSACRPWMRTACWWASCAAPTWSRRPKSGRTAAF